MLLMLRMPAFKYNFALEPVAYVCENNESQFKPQMKFKSNILKFY